MSDDTNITIDENGVSFIRPRRICTCLMSEGIYFESEETLHNSWCEGLTQRRWIVWKWEKED